MAEDRLMVRFNTTEDSEFRLWFTRLVTGHFLSMVRRLIQKRLECQHNSLMAQVIQEFQEDNVRRTADFTDQFQQASTLPLGAAPVLVTGLNMSEKEGIFSIDFQLVTKKNLNIKLPAQTVQSIVLLLEQLQTKAGWQLGHDLPFPSPSEVIAFPSSPAVPPKKLLN
ncbi:MAG: hypothetical protein JW943_07030 [Deltaproteobacteria bacterium]|nr:hypothetical protein [Deltaproteobacteria bacterium]